MSTKFYYKTVKMAQDSRVLVPDEMLPVVGNPIYWDVDPDAEEICGYVKEGPYEELSLWFDALTEYFGPMLTPGQVLMYVPVTRDAVYKAINAGLATFSYDEVGYRSKFWQKKKRHLKTRHTFVPLVEIRKWRHEIEIRDYVRRKITIPESVHFNFPKNYMDFWEWYLKNHEPFALKYSREKYDGEDYYTVAPEKTEIQECSI